MRLGRGLRAPRSVSRRGGTFTFLVLIMSVMILISGTLMADASRTTFTQVAEGSRQVDVREAAFSGVTWAARAAVVEGKAPAGLLELSAATVTVKTSLSGETLRVVSSAKGRTSGLTIEATLRRVGAAYRLESYSTSQR